MPTVVLPAKICEDFLKEVKQNTIKEIETLALLCGQRKGSISVVTHVIIPKQTGTKDRCEVSHDASEYSVAMTENNLVSFGWIHTHPTQDCFLSSIDVHTHCTYQDQTKEAVAIVCSISEEKNTAFHIPPEYLELVKNCPLSGFHPHTVTLYQAASHAIYDNEVIAEIIDLRSVII